MARSQPIGSKKKKKEKNGTYPPLQQIVRETKGDRLPHKQDKTSCDVLQLRGVEVGQGEKEVDCEVPQSRICTRQNQQHQK